MFGGFDHLADWLANPAPGVGEHRADSIIASWIKSILSSVKSCKCTLEEIKSIR